MLVPLSGVEDSPAAQERPRERLQNPRFGQIRRGEANCANQVATCRSHWPSRNSILARAMWRGALRTADQSAVLLNDFEELAPSALITRDRLAFPVHAVLGKFWERVLLEIRSLSAARSHSPVSSAALHPGHSQHEGPLLKLSTGVCNCAIIRVPMEIHYPMSGSLTQWASQDSNLQTISTLPSVVLPSVCASTSLLGLHKTGPMPAHPKPSTHRPRRAPCSLPGKRTKRNRYQTSISQYSPIASQRCQNRTPRTGKIANIVSRESMGYIPLGPQLLHPVCSRLSFQPSASRSHSVLYCAIGQLHGVLHHLDVNIAHQDELLQDFAILRTQILSHALQKPKPLFQAGNPVSARIPTPRMDSVHSHHLIEVSQITMLGQQNEKWPVCKRCLEEPVRVLGHKVIAKQDRTGNQQRGPKQVCKRCNRIHPLGAIGHARLSASILVPHQDIVKTHHALRMHLQEIHLLLQFVRIGPAVVAFAYGFVFASAHVGCVSTLKASSRSSVYVDIVFSTMKEQPDSFWILLGILYA